MDDYLAKPVRAAELFAAIERLASQGGDPGPVRPGAGGGGGLLDPAALLAACGDDAEGLRRMCHDLPACVPAQLAAVGEALRGRDAPRLREAAHKLAGMVAAFSSVAGAVASDLEDRAAQGQLEEAQPLVARLEAMAAELLRLVGGLSLQALREQAGAAEAHGAAER
jgi:two-component system sensor histidine kinase/response regulator